MNDRETIKRTIGDFYEGKTQYFITYEYMNNAYSGIKLFSRNDLNKIGSRIELRIQIYSEPPEAIWGYIRAEVRSPSTGKYYKCHIHETISAALAEAQKWIDDKIQENENRYDGDVLLCQSNIDFAIKHGLTLPPGYILRKKMHVAKYGPRVGE